jgi:hypothetical protein
VLRFLVLVKRSYVQPSSPGQTEGFKDGFKEWVDGLGLSSRAEWVVGGWVGFEFARGERQGGSIGS